MIRRSLKTPTPVRAPIAAPSSAATARWLRARRDAMPRARPRVPRAIPPTAIERSYAADLVRMVDRLRAVWAPVIAAVPSIAEDLAAERGDRMDASSGHRRLKALVDHAVTEGRKVIQVPEIERAARKTGERVSAHQKTQLRNQAKAALGVEPHITDDGLAGVIDQFVHENVALVKRIPERLHGDLEAIVSRAVNKGTRAHKGALEREIQDRFGVSQRHARLIARDQTTKCLGKITRHRHKKMGVKRWTWRTCGDERVRGTPGGKYPDAEPSHFELDGQEFDEDDPPILDGVPTRPSDPVCCRCWEEPIFE
jgi:SPP1 gp7 family putative phage head morphogenesis protein